MSGTDGATATAAGTATDAAATTTTTAAGTTTTTDTGTAAAGGAGAQTQAQPTIEQLQADVEKWKALSRKNEQTAKAKNETDAAQKKLLAEVAAKLGISTADGQPTAEQITAQLEAAQRDAASRSRELAVLRAAGPLGADGDALLDSRAFAAVLDGLDPAEPEGIKAAIRAALAQSPGKYALASAQTGAAASGTDTAAGNGVGTAAAGASSAGDFTSSSAGARQWTQADVDRATPAQVTEALANHLLDNLLAS